MPSWLTTKVSIRHHDSARYRLNDECDIDDCNCPTGSYRVPVTVQYFGRFDATVHVCTRLMISSALRMSTA